MQAQPLSGTSACAQTSLSVSSPIPILPCLPPASPSNEELSVDDLSSSDWSVSSVIDNVSLPRPDPPDLLSSLGQSGIIKYRSSPEVCFPGPLFIPSGSLSIMLPPAKCNPHNYAGTCLIQHPTDLRCTEWPRHGFEQKNHHPLFSSVNLELEALVIAKTTEES